ncbi:MAG: KamA family radical SAM protein [Geobacteraceae bacterium]|nr:KamA family radical SAM protein [Geobacteraceae bacterium]
MENWQASLADSITDPDELAGYFPCDTDELRVVVERYPMRISPHYLSLIHESGDPVWLQCVADPRELIDDGLSSDPLNEEALSPVPRLIHRYPDRVVILAASRCAVYCRFCMRKRKVGCGTEELGREGLDDAFGYIAEHSEIRDVILSGGDPLLLTDDELEDILRAVRNIPHVEIIRLGTRAPVTLPERVTSRLCRMLKRFQPLYVNTHFNHPLEISHESAEACGKLADAGIQLGNQTVLLKGVNDDPRTMKRLMQKLLAIRVRPYYLHHMDLVRGTGHFRTDVRKGIAIMEGLRGHTSGLATPYYVIDAPGGKGKIPILPDSARFEGDRLILRNYRGERIEYPY